MITLEELELAWAPVSDDDGSQYDPFVYRSVYERVLRHRHVETIAIDVILPAERLSVYDFAVPTVDLLPTEAAVEACIKEAQRAQMDAISLEREISRWWET